MNDDLLFQIMRSTPARKQNPTDGECRSFWYGSNNYVCLRIPGKPYIVTKPEDCKYFKGLNIGCTYGRKAAE